MRCWAGAACAVYLRAGSCCGASGLNQSFHQQILAADPFGPRLILAELASRPRAEVRDAGFNDHDRARANQLRETLGDLVDLIVPKITWHPAIKFDVGNDAVEQPIAAYAVHAGFSKA